MPNLSQTLSQFEVFQHFQTDELRIVTRYLSVKSFTVGETLMRKGEAGTFLCVILSGEVDIIDENVVLVTRSAGDLLGEIALIRSSPRMADVVAITDGEIAVMHYHDIEQFKLKHPRLAVKLVGILTESTMKKLTETAAALQEEKKRAEQLLLNILPLPIATKLKEGHQTIADDHADVTVLFADLVGFTSLSSTMSPTKLIVLLNMVFSMFDYMAEDFGLEKIKTIGDAYMVVGGLPEPRPDHAQAVASMSLAMQQEILQMSEESGFSLNMRIGIATGPVVAGIIGTKKFIYDLWGDTVNVASRMESSGLPGKIQVTTETSTRLQESFLLEPRGAIQVKGKGTMETYWLLGRK